MPGRAFRRTLCSLLFAGLASFSAQPVLASEDAAFIPAGQDAAWFNAATFRLTDALISREREVGVGVVTISRLGSNEPLRVPPMRVVARLANGASLGLAFEDGLDRLVADLREKGRPTFLVVGDPLVDIGFQRREQTALALRSGFAGWGVTVSAEDGQVAGMGADPLRGRGDRRTLASAARYGLSIDREFGDILAVLGGSWLTENQTILGARVRQGYGTSGADSLFLDAALSWRPRSAWRLGAAWRRGTTTVGRISGMTGDQRLITSAWAVDLTRFGVLSPEGAMSLRVSQPLRVNGSGGRGLPVEYGYELRGMSRVATGATMTPTGREIAAELNWQGPLLRGWVAAGLYFRRDPGHFAGLPDDRGAAFSWSARF